MLWQCYLLLLLQQCGIAGIASVSQHQQRRRRQQQQQQCCCCLSRFTCFTWYECIAYVLLCRWLFVYACSLCYYVPQVVLLDILHAFLRRPWVFSRALGRGSRRGAACSPLGKFGCRAGSVARAPGVQSRKNLASNRGIVSLGAGAEQENGKPTCQLFCSTAVKGSNTVTTISLSVPRPYSYGHYYAHVDHYYACVVMMRVYSVYRSVHV